MQELQIFLTHPDPSNPYWWAAVAIGLVALAGLWDTAYPRAERFVAWTANKWDDRIVAALRPVGSVLRGVAAFIRFWLPLARLPGAAPPPASGGGFKDAYGDEPDALLASIRDPFPGEPETDERSDAMLRLQIAPVPNDHERLLGKVMCLEIAPMGGLVLALVLAGCGASSNTTAHGRLNRMTDYADPTYQLAVDVCRELQLAAVAHAETRAEAVADVAEIRRVCDHAYDLLRSAAAAQLMAREAVDAAEDGRLTLPEAINAIDEAEALYRRARDFVRGLLARRGGDNG